MNLLKNEGELNSVPIHASLWRSVLLAGADRRITITIMGSCMVLVLLSRFALWPCLTALVLATIGQILGIKLAAVDPAIIDIYLRHLSYGRVYSARTDLSSAARKPYPSVPRI